MFCRRNPRLPQELICAIKQQQLLPTRWILSISVADQTMRLLERSNHQANASFPRYILRQKYRVSTAAKGAGQEINSNRTPLGLHRVAEKIGGGQPIGTVFRNRQPVGLTWLGLPAGSIVHRILWLEGLQPGWNRGGTVDTFGRYIYIHGFGDETTLGRPVSRGCIHLAAQDLIPLFDVLPVGTHVWIGER